MCLNFQKSPYFCIRLASLHFDVRGWSGAQYRFRMPNILDTGIPGFSNGPDYPGRVRACRKRRNYHDYN